MDDAVLEPRLGWTRPGSRRAGTRRRFGFAVIPPTRYSAPELCKPRDTMPGAAAVAKVPVASPVPGSAQVRVGTKPEEVRRAPEYSSPCDSVSAGGVRGAQRYAHHSEKLARAKRRIAPLPVAAPDGFVEVGRNRAGEAGLPCMSTRRAGAREHDVVHAPLAPLLLETRPAARTEQTRPQSLNFYRTRRCLEATWGRSVRGRRLERERTDADGTIDFGQGQCSERRTESREARIVPR